MTVCSLLLLPWFFSSGQNLGGVWCLTFFLVDLFSLSCLPLCENNKGQGIVMFNYQLGQPVFDAYDIYCVFAHKKQYAHVNRVHLASTLTFDLEASILFCLPVECSSFDMQHFCSVVRMQSVETHYACTTVLIGLGMQMRWSCDVHVTDAYSSHPACMIIAKPLLFFSCSSFHGYQTFLKIWDPKLSK